MDIYIAISFSPPSRRPAFICLSFPGRRRPKTRSDIIARFDPSAAPSSLCAIMKHKSERFSPVSCLTIQFGPELR